MTIAITGRAMKNLPMTSHFAGADASGPGDVGCGAATPGLVPVDGALLFSGGGALPIGSVDVSAGLVVTACPARILPVPSMTIRSPSVSPSSTTTNAPDVGPSLTGRNSTFSSGRTMVT